MGGFGLEEGFFGAGLNCPISWFLSRSDTDSVCNRKHVPDGHQSVKTASIRYYMEACSLGCWLWCCRTAGRRLDQPLRFSESVRMFSRVRGQHCRSLPNRPSGPKVTPPTVATRCDASRGLAVGYPVVPDGQRIDDYQHHGRQVISDRILRQAEIIRRRSGRVGRS